jgi:hypothetical protein
MIFDGRYLREFIADPANSKKFGLEISQTILGVKTPIAAEPCGLCSDWEIKS